ncbi:styrene monooxygenase/indole monooxygenase family protein [Streptomyces sp. TP-A0874]|uniref:styrene monooxygenase/indole monooxygenase family protein n=1 Tax=Streptomyces sp. TP-A0874 TaxID=549819 RepID=UPI000AD00159|nr:styrene monooxygenase/indole monooxygenase family protein [Streptomyces sp. TP-A0874]
MGADQAGLQLALGLLTHGYQVTLMSERTPDEVRSGRVRSVSCMFHSALQHERDLGLNFWESQTPRLTGLTVSMVAEDSVPTAGSHGSAARAVEWTGRLTNYAQSVDQRVKRAGWMEVFARRGGQLVIHRAAISDLDYFAGRYDLVLVAAARGELVSLFDRDAARSPQEAPRRVRAVSYVHGLRPRTGRGCPETVRWNLVPGVGELSIVPSFTITGGCHVLSWESVPGGPADVFQEVCGPEAHLASTLELMSRYTPWELAGGTEPELTDAGGTLVGGSVPTVRRPVGRLPSGGAVLGVAETVMASGPLPGQGAGSAARCAAVYLDRILERGAEPFDEAWMQGTFDRHWRSTRQVARWTEAMLAEPRSRMLRLLRDAAGSPDLANRFANGFDDPSALAGHFWGRQRAGA